jgi:hypothetical protein
VCRIRCVFETSIDAIALHAKERTDVMQTRASWRGRYALQNHAAITFIGRKEIVHNSICTIMKEARGLGIATRAPPTRFSSLHV